jgi:hypothetical protein
VGKDLLLVGDVLDGGVDTERREPLAGELLERLAVGAAGATSRPNSMHTAARGLIAVRATVGTTTWDTSLLPLGDGTTFVPLNARVRRQNDLVLGAPVTVTVVPRDRSPEPATRRSPADASGPTRSAVCPGRDSNPHAP